VSDDDLPPLQPPEIWLHDGKKHYFGAKRQLPPGTVRGDMRLYTNMYMAARREREAKIRAAHEALQVDRLKRGEEAEPPLLDVDAFAPERERQAPSPPPPVAVELLDPPPPAPAPPLPAPPLPAPPLPDPPPQGGLYFQRNSPPPPAEPRPPHPHEGAPSPLTNGARLSFSVRESAPDPLPPRRPMRKATFERVLSEALEDESVEGLMVRLHRVLPDPGYLEDLDVRDAYEHASSLGALRTYLKANHYDGRPTKVRVHLLINDEEAGDGPWTVDLPKDPIRIEMAKLDQEVQIANLRAERGLPPLAAAAPAAPAPPRLPPAPLPAVPEPTAGFYTAAQLDQAIAATLARLLQAKGAEAPAPAAPAAPAPAAPPPEQVYTKAEVEAKITEAVEKVTSKNELEALKEKAADAKSTLATIAEIAGTNGHESKSEPDDPTIEKSGIHIPREMFSKNPTSALVMSNWPMVQGLIGSMKDGVKEVVQEVVKAGREQTEDELKRLEVQERKLALAERARALKNGEPRGDSGVVESSDWAPPRQRPAK